MIKIRSVFFRNIIILVATVILLITCILNLINPTTRKINDWLYPLKYEDTVRKYAKIYHVEAALAQAVIKEESKFNERALSISGAIGLMQIMPDTGEWIAEQLDEDYGDLYEVDRNIRYGIWYLAELTAEFNGNRVLVLAAYNAGRGTVWDWIDEYGWNKDFNDIDAIPYTETRKYVKRVLKSCDKYRSIFNGREVRQHER